MAEDLDRREHEHADIVVPPRSMEPLVAPVRRVDSRFYRYRFGIAYLALALVAGLAVGGAIVLADRPTDRGTAIWSSWRPTGSQATYAEQIADHVASRYRLPSGRQLVGVVAGRPEVQGLPVQGVFIQHESPVRSRADDIQLVSTGKSVMYQLCGLGRLCSISEGEATATRLQVLKRQALEMALYTFKYVSDADSVIAILPTDLRNVKDNSDDTTTTLFFQRKHFKDVLEQPLSQTMLTAGTFRATELAPDALVVDRLTRGRLFTFKFEQLTTGGIAMVLASPRAAG